MHAGRNYSLAEMTVWTRRETLVFLVVGAVPTVLYAVFGWTWITVPWLPIALVGTAVAFITGFKNNASYDRVWEARKIWGGIVNASRTWALMTLDFVTPLHAKEPVSAEQLGGARTRLIHRHLAWVTALRFQLRTPRPWEEIHQRSHEEYRADLFSVVEIDGDLGDELVPLLSPEEHAEVLRLTNPATQILRLQSGALRGLLEEGLLEDFRHMEMQAVLTELVNEQGRCERIKNFPYPRQFATLNLVFVWLFVLLVPLGLLPEFARFGDAFVWLTIPFSTLVAWIFHTIDKIGGVSENPFEGGANDVPITALARTIEIDLREMLDEEDIPAPLEPVNHILM